MSRKRVVDEESLVVGYFNSKPVEVARATLNIVTAIVRGREPQAVQAPVKKVRKVRAQAPAPTQMSIPAEGETI